MLAGRDKQNSKSSADEQLTARKVLATLEKADCASGSSLMGSGRMSNLI